MENPWLEMLPAELPFACPGDEEAVAAFHDKYGDRPAWRLHLDLRPDETGGGVWEIDVNRFDSSETRLFDLNRSDARIALSYTRVLFEDGEELKIYESLSEAKEVGEW